MKREANNFNRRGFLGSMMLASTLLLACGKKRLKASLDVPTMLDAAPDGPPLKAGLVGCGGRGTGAALNFLDAGPNLQITALADVFPDRVASCREKLKLEKGVEVLESQCFVGFEAYQALINSDVDIVLLATPPYFRPQHLEACVLARKHAFIEKPVAVDAVGVRSVLSSAERAKSLGLTLICGTQQRHSRDYLATYERVMDGAIGEIVAGNAYFNTGQLWYRDRQPNWSDMEYMLRDWVNWRWLSGDHIVEQFVHKIDLINMYLDGHPIKAVAIGARHRRPTGDQYDCFGVDYVYDKEIHVHGLCRQIDGCSNNVSHFIRGTKGYTNCHNKIWRPDGSLLWEYPYLKNDKGEPTTQLPIPSVVQEHIDLVTAIRTNKPRVEAQATAFSTLTCIMGRDSAYTGKEVAWDQLLISEEKLGPQVLEMGPVDLKIEIPVPGVDKTRT